jgi:hypothetical protein
MDRERQTILSLVALGRITPAEAERLLSASATVRDELLVIAVLAGIGVAQVLPVLAHVALTAFPVGHRLVAALAASM